MEARVWHRHTQTGCMGNRNSPVPATGGMPRVPVCTRQQRAPSEKVRRDRTSMSTHAMPQFSNPMYSCRPAGVKARPLMWAASWGLRPGPAGRTVCTLAVFRRSTIWAAPLCSAMASMSAGPPENLTHRAATPHCRVAVTSMERVSQRSTMPSWYAAASASPAGAQAQHMPASPATSLELVWRHPASAASNMYKCGVSPTAARRRASGCSDWEFMAVSVWITAVRPMSGSA
mmetsp:Transcript_13099/g.39657  ORF Transcript_13099/g.39657 Transcript_13099/m.39657 type:complete len:231 (+) Transcript_13099:578-1270(+)